MSTRRALAALIPAAVLTLGLTACGTSSAEPTAGPQPTPGTSTSAAPTPSVSVNDTAAEASIADAERAAVAALQLYLTRLPADQWWSQLSPHLSPEASYEIEGTDPQQIPATVITGPPVSVASSSTFVSVLLPTDAGQYQLDVTKRGDNPSNGTWIVFALTPPEGTR